MAPSNPNEQHEKNQGQTSQDGGSERIPTSIATDTIAEFSEGINRMNLNLASMQKPYRPVARQVSFVKEKGFGGIPTMKEVVAMPESSPMEVD